MGFRDICLSALAKAPVGTSAAEVDRQRWSAPPNWRTTTLLRRACRPNDVRHSLISAVGAHPSAFSGVCGGSLCASLASRRIGAVHPVLADQRRKRVEDRSCISSCAFACRSRHMSLQSSRFARPLPKPRLWAPPSYSAEGGMGFRDICLFAWAKATEDDGDKGRSGGWGSGKASIFLRA